MTVLLLSWVAGGGSDTLHLLFGNVLAVETTSVVALTIIALVVVSMQLLVGRRFLLVTFDPEAATVAGVNTRLWSLILNLAIGVAAAAAVQAIGALPTFAPLTLPAVAALLATRSVRATFATATVLSITLPSLALAVSFYLDLPPVGIGRLLAIGSGAGRGPATGLRRAAPPPSCTSVVRAVSIISPSLETRRSCALHLSDR